MTRVVGSDVREFKDSQPRRGLAGCYGALAFTCLKGRAIVGFPAKEKTYVFKGSLTAVWRIDCRGQVGSRESSLWLLQKSR